MPRRSKRWNASPSMSCASIFSRRKMFTKLDITVVVPAPEEPVTAMTGCCVDMARFSSSGARFGTKQRALVEQRRDERFVLAFVEFAVIAFDAFDFAARTE